MTLLLNKKYFQDNTSSYSITQIFLNKKAIFQGQMNALAKHI